MELLILGPMLPSSLALQLLEMSPADRLAIMGQSYGSYTALCVLVQSQRFKAAVLTAAVVVK